MEADILSLVRVCGDEYVQLVMWDANDSISMRTKRKTLA